MDMQEGIRPLSLNDAEQELILQRENRMFFEWFAMSRQGDFYTLEGRKKRIEQSLKNAENDTEYSFGIFLQADPDWHDQPFSGGSGFPPKRFYRLFFRWQI